MEEAWGKLAPRRRRSGLPGPRLTSGSPREPSGSGGARTLHDQQARTSQELRVVEREAQRREGARRRRARAASRATSRSETPSRRAREAEAGRGREGATSSARDARGARGAEREATKEDAERGAAIAASLGAMCEDLEKLADRRTGARSIGCCSRRSESFEQIGKVSAGERDALSDRYTAARGKLVVRAQELREAEDWARFQNVPKAEALIPTAKAMAVDAPATPDLGNRLRQLQALWKEVGPMPQRRSKELWELFKATCDQLYEQSRCSARASRTGSPRSRRRRKR